MIPGISSQVFLPFKLDTTHLDALRAGGAQAIELWAARYHVDYTDRAQTRELAAWFGANGVVASLHAPLTTDTHYSRHGAPDIDLLDADRGRRIAAMDEIKRALELAETLPIRTCVLHLGVRGDRWSEHALEHSLTAVEHLKAFATPLGVRLLLENLPNEIATAEHLETILRIGHFDTCGICLDTGHAHLSEAGLMATLELLRPRIAELHLHDNDGTSDTHLWPASGAERPAWAARGTIDWAAMYRFAEALPAETLGILEIMPSAATAKQVGALAGEVWSHARRLGESEPTSIVETA